VLESATDAQSPRSKTNAISCAISPSIPPRLKHIRQSPAHKQQYEDHQRSNSENPLQRTGKKKKVSAKNTLKFKTKHKHTSGEHPKIEDSFGFKSLFTEVANERVRLIVWVEMHIERQGGACRMIDRRTGGAAHHRVGEFFCGIDGAGRERGIAPTTTTTPDVRDTEKKKKTNTHRQSQQALNLETPTETQ
jgi:hypothetical protein